MTIDPDLLAIWRLRRRQKRCLHCGTPTPRAALCMTCRAVWRYCPRCEVVWQLAAPRQTIDGRASDYCGGCASAARHGPKPTRAAYQREQRARTHPLLKDIIARYKAGETYDTIAQALGVPRGTISSLITHARATGRWPARLARGQGRRGKLAV